ncbi:hypothetical protein COTS27_00092 [Spirochaetota bacterium]|nr:hypothetical protein COTS27_00092 [Spirochaetota bacterium]
MTIENFNKKLLGSYRNIRLGVWEFVSAGIFSVAALIFYALTMHPSMSAGDNGELTVAMFYLGIAHAPGYPLHSFLGKLFTFIPFSSPAWNANFFSAAAAATTLFFCALLYMKLLLSMGILRGYAIVAALIGASAFMLSETFWAQAGMAEVYTISSIFPPLLLLILIIWQDDVIRNANSPHLYFGEPYLLAYAFLMGFGLGGHQTLAITEILGGIHIAGVLICFQILPRREWITQFKKGLPHLLFVIVLLLFAWVMYFAHLYSREVSLYENNHEHTKKGVLRFVFANLLLLAYYLGFKFAPKDMIDHNNPYQRTALSVVKFFGMLYLGLTIYLYMLIRGHSSPPINWGGIGEELTGWGKLAKFFSIINRKQFPSPNIERTLPNILYQIKLSIEHIHGMQYSLPFFITMGLGWLYGLFKYPLFIIIYTIGFIAFNIQLVFILNFEPTPQSLSIVEVFYITSYFLLSVMAAFGVAAFLVGMEKSLNLLTPNEKKPKKNTEPIAPSSPPPSSTAASTPAATSTPPVQETP